MSNTNKYRNRLITLLKELFQLDQPELDFGLYKIMHAKSVQITRFLENDLLKEITQAFGEKDQVDASQLKANATEKLKAALGEEALDERGQLNPIYANTPAGKAYLQQIAAAEAAKDTLNAEAEVYDHLYRFFERYYDSGDFMSRRYYARESDSRAAPYAVPYDGREVYLHWANKDQYYIKSSEYLTNYTFELNAAIVQEAERQKRDNKNAALDLGGAISEKPQKVHFRIVSASEGEHGNIKAGNDQKRFFVIHADEPVKLENGELIIQFQYRNDPDKSGQDKTWQESLLSQAEARIYEALQGMPEDKGFMQGLKLPAPTDSKKDRTLLSKHLQKYSNRNTMDYFIHKDLGGFLRRELDFYIKNEIMRLDDIENAEAPKVEQYLSKIKVLRRIAHQLIAFLAQLENFQKKLWLKKKFVTETQYCITLDRIPESFYPEIAANEKQREEWVKLFAIDEIKGDLVAPGYGVPLAIEFLKASPFLLIDTAFFENDFKARLLNEIQGLDQQCDGLLVHSENFQALNLLRKRYCEQVKCTYIDPPYNTGGDGFAYKDSYQHSSWITMVRDRLYLANAMLKSKGVLFSSIDSIERANLEQALNETMGSDNRVEEIIWVQNTTKNQSPTYSTNHEYILAYARNSKEAKADFAMFRESKAGFSEIMGLLEEINPQYPPISEVEKKLKELYRKHKDALGSDEGGALDDWKGIYNYSRAEYRDENGHFVEEKNARSVNAKIWVWREVDVSMPQIKEDSQREEFRDPLHELYRFYTPTHPITGKKCPAPKRGWAWPFLPSGKQKSSFQELDKDRRIAWGEDERKVPQRKSFIHEVETNVAKSVVIDFTDGEKELNDVFGRNRVFAGPKPTTLIGRLIQHGAVSDGDVVCDFYAGSGTTGQAVMKMNAHDKRKRKLLLIEMGNHFSEVLKPRLLKIAYASTWNGGRPDLQEGGRTCFFKYLRLESYEDTLSNMVLKQDECRDIALEKHSNLQRDYLLNYFLDVETEGSQSLLNIAGFRDPTAYKMWIKKPGSEEQTLQTIDLIETFNWLIGLWVDHLAAPQTFDAEFVREKDKDLPEDQNTRLVCTRLKRDDKGAYWFRLVEGYTLRVPGDNTSKVPILIIWRKLTDDAEKDNAALQKYLEVIKVSTREKAYEVIYVNGSHTLPNPVVEGEHTKVRLIEEAFHQAMWAEV